MREMKSFVKNNWSILSLILFMSGMISACRPGPVDPPLDINFNRVDVKPSLEGLAENHPLQQIGASKMWATSSGKSKTGERVVIAAIGTGVDYTNPDIKNSLWINAGEVGEKLSNNGFDDDGNGFADDLIGFDFFSGDGNPYDWHGYDTFTAGVMVGAGLEHPEVKGLAPNASLMVLRYLGPDGRGAAMDAFMAIHYAIDNGANAIYFNWPKGGFGKEDALVIAALKAAGENNIPVAIPAGNDGNQQVPSLISSGQLQELDNVLVVSAVGVDGKLASNTNHGIKISTIAAPEGPVMSFMMGHEVTDQIHSSAVSAAYVAASAALMSTFPGNGRASDIKAHLMKNADAERAGQLDVLSGGSLNLVSAN